MTEACKVNMSLGEQEEGPKSTPRVIWRELVFFFSPNMVDGSGNPETTRLDLNKNPVNNRINY